MSFSTWVPQKTYCWVVWHQSNPLITAVWLGSGKFGDCGFTRYPFFLSFRHEPCWRVWSKEEMWKVSLGNPRVFQKPRYLSKTVNCFIPFLISASIQPEILPSKQQFWTAAHCGMETLECLQWENSFMPCVKNWRLVDVSANFFFL